MKSWINAIKNFQSCSKDGNGKQSTSNSINKVLQNRRSEAIEELKRIEAIQQEAEAKKREMEAQENKVSTDEDIELDEDFLNLKKELKESDQIEKLEKRQKTMQMELAKKKLRRIKEQRQCLEEAIKQKEVLEQASAEIMIKEVSTKLIK